MIEVNKEFVRLPPQKAFWESEAKIRGYGGAMGGGKSRTMGEQAFVYAIQFPGILIPIGRQAHTSITNTTRKTFLTQVLPPELQQHCKIVDSGGKDFVRLWNGSEIHFIGLDDPVRWFSSEIGALFIDEAQEVDEETAQLMVSRLRQRCVECVRDGVKDCAHMPHKACFSFNPDNPGHWLYNWFFEGATQTEHGFRKKELWIASAIASIGSAEFVQARATDNPYLPTGYVEQSLGGMREGLRRRMLDGLWEFISGNSFFDADSLSYYDELSRKFKARLTGRMAGDAEADFKFRSRRMLQVPKDKIRVARGDGPLTIWKLPVRGENPHRYVMGIDVSSGKAKDYSAIQVVDQDSFEQVAEYQVKMPPTEVALEAYRLGRFYNNAKAVPEITGGWGYTVEQELKRLHYPNLFTRRILDRLSQRWTDKTGWDTTVKSRAHMLDTLYRILDEREFGMYSLRTVKELATFVLNEKGKPEAQPGCNDDLVMSLAIAVTIATSEPRKTTKLREDPHEPIFSSTGY